MKTKIIFIAALIAFVGCTKPNTHVNSNTLHASGGNASAADMVRVTQEYGHYSSEVNNGAYPAHHIIKENILHGSK